MSSKFLKSILKEVGNEYATVAKEDDREYGMIDTGSYVLNAQLSGSIYGGLSDNQITIFAGPEAVGKTFFLLQICKKFLEDNPDAVVFWFDTEGQPHFKDILEALNIDLERFVILPVATVEDWRTQGLRILRQLKEKEDENRPKAMMCIDSLGNLSTKKEMTDISSGDDKRDMTRAQLMRGAFRVLTLELSRLNVPLLCTNHVYDVVGAYIPTKEMSGGMGAKYAASNIVYLSKSVLKDKETKEVLGNTITSFLDKGRPPLRDKTKVETRLLHGEGLDRYYGLLPFALKHKIFNQLAKQIELPDGSKVFESKIKENPEKFFTKEILDRIDAAVKADFLLGEGGNITNEEE